MRKIRLLAIILMATCGLLSPAINSSAQSTSGQFTDQISYTNDIRPVVNSFCTTCHAGDDPEGEFVLTSYETVREYTERGDLLKRIQDQDDPMPPSGLIPSYMRRLFQLWADQGYVNQGRRKASGERTQMQDYTPPAIQPVDINRQGFEMLDYMQGHWVGSMNLMGMDYEWMAFDYRPIAPSHIHGIFEGGTIGNLFTSFFVTEFRGTRTIMARNGGILNGIYRTSYFVLDQVQQGRQWAAYRLVDAQGGKDIMWMELTFSGDTLDFKAFTSRFGLTAPRQHMVFKGRRMHPELSAKAANAVGFPKNVVDYDFSGGLPKPSWADEHAHTSASYICEDKGKQLLELAKLSKDPRHIDQMPYLSRMTVHVERNASIAGKKLHLYLSRDALVDQAGRFITQAGYIREDLLDTLLVFPEIAPNVSEFTFTYLHPGDYYLTVVADMDRNGYPSPGDITHARRRVSVPPKSHPVVTIKDINVRN